jgi:hypothetical protein
MLTIVWDLDDVLNNLTTVWLHEHWLPVHPECRIGYDALCENPPHRLLGVPEREYLASLDEFRASARARDIPPNAAVLDWLERFGARFRHVALTARPLESAGAGSEWLFRHFARHIRVFAVVPFRLEANAPSYDRNKGDFLRWLKQADILVDDSAANVAVAGEAGVRGLLFPQPWNSSPLSVAGTLEHLTRMTLE